MATEANSVNWLGARMVRKGPSSSPPSPATKAPMHSPITLLRMTGIPTNSARISYSRTAISMRPVRLATSRHSAARLASSTASAR